MARRSQSVGGKGPSDPTTVAALTPDPSNRRTHPERNVEMIAASLRSVGAARSIVIDEANEVLAGNGVLQGAARAGISKLKIVDVEGDTVVAVRRRGLSAEQKRDLAIYDNRSAELAAWDIEQLRLDVNAGLDLQPFFFEPELAALLGRGGKPGLTDPDAVPAERPTGIVRGDLFDLGRHRLLCGDATSQGDVARVLAGERPYGVDYDPTWRGEAGVNRNPNKIGRVANDDQADWGTAWKLFQGDVAYVWHAGLKAGVVEASLAAHGFAVRSQIIWAKDRFALSRGDYHWQHEPCWYAVRVGAAGHRTTDRSQSTLWTIPAREDGGHGHGTQKPVECMARPMLNHEMLLVYEPFSGSGTTLIAAEQHQRRCVAIEIMPTYVQMAIDRWEAFTGQQAVKVGEAVRA